MTDVATGAAGAETVYTLTATRRLLARSPLWYHNNNMFTRAATQRMEVIKPRTMIALPKNLSNAGSFRMRRRYEGHVKADRVFSAHYVG